MSAVDVGSQGLSEYREIQLRELLETHDLVDIYMGNARVGSDSFIVVSERIPGTRTAGTISLAAPALEGDLSFRELGYTSTSPFTAWTREDHVPELRGKLGIRKWYDLKRNDGAVRGALLLVKTPIRAARWYIEPGGDTTIDKNIAEFVHDCLFDDMNVDFSSTLDDVLTMFEYGYSVLEQVYKFRPDGKVGIRKLAPRHPLDIREWVFDDRGGPAGIIMEPFVPYGINRSGYTPLPGPQNPDLLPSPDFEPFIPIRKLAIFSLEAEAGDLSGISVLRSAYKHWYYKDTLYKIDAIQKERHGIGVPVIKLPPGYSDVDKARAEDLGRNLRTNDKSHIVIPTNWEVMFAKLEGQPVDCIKSIDHHNDQIKVNVLAPFMGDAQAGEDSMDMFFKSTRYLAESISNIFNKFVIPRLVELNFSRGKTPKLRARRIGEWNDLRTWSFAFRNLVGSGALIPDDPLELFLRNELDLPKPDPATARIVEAPPGPEEVGDDANVPGAPKPSRAGPPRQPKPSANLGRGNQGRDNSGDG